MMDNKMLCYVLTLSEPDPTLASRVLGDEVGEVVDLVFNNPEVFCFWLPKFLVSLLLFLHVNQR